MEHPVYDYIISTGNDGCGKTSLVTKIRRSGEELLRGSGLEYTYIDVDDEERDGMFIVYVQLFFWCHFSLICSFRPNYNFLLIEIFFYSKLKLKSSHFIQ